MHADATNHFLLNTIIFENNKTFLITCYRRPVCLYMVLINCTTVTIYFNCALPVVLYPSSPRTKIPM